MSADSVPQAPVPASGPEGFRPPPAVERLWFLDRLHPGWTAHHLAVGFRFRERVHEAALRRAAEAVVARHDAFRMCLPMVRGGPRVRLVEDFVLPWRRREIGTVPDREATLRELLAADASEPFDLEHGPLVRASLIRAAEADFVLLVAVHHVVFDTESTDLVSKELLVLYRAFEAGQPEPDLDPPQRLRDYADWCASRLDTPRMQRSRAYWRKRLAGVAPVALPGDRPAPDPDDWAGGQLSFDLDASLAGAVRKTAADRRTTPLAVLLAAYAAVLHRWTGQEDVAVAIPMPDGGHRAFANLVCLTLNLVLVRLEVSGDLAFEALLGRVGGRLREAVYHREVPFDEVVSSLPGRQAGRAPVANISFAMRSSKDPTEHVRGVARNTVEYDLSLRFDELRGRWSASIDYRAAVLGRDGAERFARHYRSFLEAATGQPTRPIGDAPLMDARETRRVLVEWNAAARGLGDASLTLASLFDERLRAGPDKSALIHGDERLDYAGLDRRLRRILAGLAGHGVGRGDRVGLHLARSFDQVAGVLAAAHGGFAYVPLDPGYPKARLRFMIEDSGARAVVTTRAGRQALRELAGTATSPVLVDVDDLPDVPDTPSVELPRIGSEEALYVLYTSGSTGQPKGVLGTHGATVNRLRWMWRDVPFADGEVACQKTVLGFVDSVWEILGPLLAGIPSVQVDEADVQDPRRLADVLERHGVTRIVVVPSLLEALLDESGDALANRLPRLTTWVSSGETLPVALALRFGRAAPGARLLNLYGSSEVAGDATWYDVAALAEGAGRVPIGRPIQGAAVYVLDPRGRPTPIGVPGEIHVGGALVALGYHERPDLTAERFATDPFAPEPGGRLFRTGDRGRWLPSGNLEHLGRLDGRIKLRGFRIEPAEIEAALSRHPAVERSAVVLREVAGGPGLVAFVVPADEAGVAETELRGHLRELLPEFMVPARFVRIDSLPLTPNGKLDRMALAALDVPAAAPAPEARAHTPLERLLLEIWQETLESPEPVGVDDDFFDRGGHSMLAVDLLDRVQEALGRDVPLALLFQAPTVAGFARAVTALDARQPAPTIVAVQPHGTRPPLLFLPAPGFMYRHRMNIVGLRNLAQRLGGDQPLYAFCLPGDEPQYRVRRFGDLAERIETDAQAAGLSGTLHVAGYSLGGWIAVLLARRLVASGRATPRVVLFDTYGSHFPRSVRGLERLRRSWWTARLEGIWDARSPRSKGAAAPPIQEPPPPGSAQLIRLQGDPARPLPTLLFRSDFYGYDRRGLSYDEPTNGWGRMKGFALETVVLPNSRHGDLLDPPWIETVAPAVRRLLAGESGAVVGSGCGGS